jgi:uncharacterized protein YpmS
MDEKMKKLKTIFYLMIGLIILLSVMLVFTMVQVRQYQSIGTGTYYTYEECSQICSEREFPLALQQTNISRVLQSITTR